LKGLLPDITGDSLEVRGFMNENPPETNKKAGANKWLFLAGGIILGAAAVTLCILIIGVTLFFTRKTASEETRGKTPDALVQLAVAGDGCGVERSEVSGASPVQSLTWVVTDANGYVVLERNAEGEHQYRYYGDGQYRVHIKAWHSGQYHPISNEVLIDCK
jgi:hypothetical protein